MTQSVVEHQRENLTDRIETGPIQVLHVDDDSCFLKTSKSVLEMQGVSQVDTASSVEEAEEKMKQKAYDAVICDYQLPGKDGLRFLKELREERNDIPFIIFTGRGKEEIAVQALNSGADRYFSKHGETEAVYGELVHGVLQAVERKRTNDALRERERQSRTLLENLPQKIFFKDRNSIYISCNENYAQDLKIEAEEIKGKADFDFFPKGLAEKYIADDKRVMESGDIEDIEEEYIQDGQTTYVHTVKTPVKDESGNVVGLLGIFWDITERRKAEESARASSERYWSYIGLTGQLGWTTNANGEVEEDILPWRKFTGQSYEEVKGLGWTKALHPDDLEHTTRVWKKAVAAKNAYEIEYRIRRYDGVYRYFLARGVPVFKGDGSIREWVGTCIDITERRQWEETLRDAKEKWASLTENTDDIVMIVDSKGVIQFINRTMPPYTPEETIGKTVYEYVPREQRDMLRSSIKKTFEIGAPLSYVVSSNIPKAGTVWFRTKVVPVRDDEKTVGAILVSTDITEYEKLLGELKDANQRLNLLFESAPDAYYISDLKGKLLDGNRIAREITGYTKDELVGKSFLKLKLLSRSQILKAAKLLTVNALGKATGPDEFTLNRKDGTQVPVEIRTYPAKIKGKTAVLGIVRDISERKKLEEKLRVVGGLTRHDVRNKLSAVTGNAYLLRRKLAGDPQALEQLSNIEAAVRLVEKIFEFARAYEKLGVEELAYINAGKAFDEAASLFSDYRGIKVVNECRGLTVLGDSLLRQLFFNLIDDSLKYGEKIHQIRVHCRTTSMDQLELVYEDDGVGIPDDMRSHLFKEGVGKGTGYGLFMIKRICEVYGWTIRETGMPGKGAQFTMTIPQSGEDGRTKYELH